MFQKLSLSVPSDSSYVLLAKVIQTRRCNSRRHAGIGKFLRIVNQTHKVVKVPASKRKFKICKKSRALTIRSKQYYKYGRGDLIFNFAQNNLVLLRRRMNVRGKKIYGPSCKHLKIKKFFSCINYLF
jgi:ribosomal protein L14